MYTQIEMKHIYICIYIYIHTYIHIYIYIYIHTHIHTHTHIILKLYKPVKRSIDKMTNDIYQSHTCSS